jgi:hypothetical protein
MDDLKYFALTYINLQDNLTEQEKNKLAKFVVESTEDQIKFLLSKGCMTNKKSELNEVEGINVGGLKGATFLGSDSGFLNITLGPNALTALAAVGGITAAALLITAAAKVYNRFISVAGRKCQDYKGGISRELCLVTVKTEAVKKQMEQLSKVKSACSKSKDPKKCSSKIESRLAKLKLKYDRYESNRKAIKSRITQRVGTEV